MKRLINYIIIAEILINILMRQISWEVQNYGNMVCLTILSVVAYLISKGNDKCIALFASFLFLFQCIDIKYFNQFKFQADDLLLIGAAAVLTILLSRKHFTKSRITLGGAVLLSAVTLYSIATNQIHANGKLITIYLNGMDRSYFEMGNTVVHVLLALYVYNRIDKATWFHPIGVLLLGLTANDLQDNLRGDPYSLNFEEPYILGIFVIVAIVGSFINNPRRTATGVR